MTLPRVALVLLTYEPGGDGARDTAIGVLRALLYHVKYSGELQLHIADDGSPGDHRQQLLSIAGATAVHAQYGCLAAITSSDAERGGYGRSYNLATHDTHAAAEVILPVEDDWLLTRELDLDPLVRTLVEPGEAIGIESIRLGYLGWTQPLRGLCIHTPAGPMLRLDEMSDERHVFSGHPRLETRDYQRRVGLWPEGRPAGETEFEVSGRAESRIGVAWPLDYGPASMRSDSLFTHIGSVSLNQLDPGGV